MKLLISLTVLFMSLDVFTKETDWERFNSSLLIEVTRPNGVFTCTGVVVSQDVVITAAHCLDGSVKEVKIFTQDIYKPSNTSLPVKEYKLHPLYDPKKSRYKSDLAKIMMKEKLPPFIKIYPIYKGNKIFGNLYRFGFGARDNKNLRTVITPTLRKMNVEEEILELNDKFSKSGDSGGPIFMENDKEIKILAIHSTFSHGPQGNYSLNPLLGAYIHWIFEN